MFHYAGNNVINQLQHRVEIVAAALVAAGLGLITSVEDAKKLIPASKTFFPNAENKAVYDKAFEVYKTLYKNNKSAFAALNG